MNVRNTTVAFVSVACVALLGNWWNDQTKDKRSRRHLRLVEADDFYSDLGVTPPAQVS